VSNFRTIQVQAVLFTSEVSYRGTRFLGYFLSKWGELFNGEPTSFEPPTDVLLPGLPRAILKSEDSLIRLQVSTERLDFFRNSADNSSVDTTGHFQLSIDIFNDYLEYMRAKSGRVASVVMRAAEDEDPARTISKHFCREELLEGPIHRPSEFEVHSMKNYRLTETIEVNSWVRCKSGKIIKADLDKTERRVVLLEQDLNTPSDKANERMFSRDDIREFFTLAPNELDRILRLYFPGH